MEVTEVTRKDEAKVIAGVLVMGIIFGAEIFFMVLTLAKEPQVLAMIYDKITLPAWLHFITHFKLLFNLLVFLAACVPAGIIFHITDLVFTAIPSRELKAKEL